ncbi:chondroitinase-B domain-containing protein [Sinomicrobium sp. M5D2P17]
MKNIYTCLFCILIFQCLHATGIKVSTEEELNKAIKQAVPGDTIVMANKTWTNTEIRFFAEGEPGKQIVLKAETPGEVILSGMSRLMIAGKYLVVNGLWFRDGNTMGKPVISFRKNKEEVAFYSRVTNCAVTGYNPDDRSLQYQWVELWGQHNRVDHCTFQGKTNQGPVLIVGLKDNRINLENHHRIDHNLFGHRPPLGSNGGETIRIGTSHTSLESSGTVVEENLFERCNGEVEIISSKSCDNIYRNNLFIESEGGLVLRHGNRCLVEGNIFFGNNKPHTGGVRVINEGHIVQNNLMMGLTGDGFRSPLVIMNGVPDGPLNRYNQVKDAVIQNNTFINCAPLELCAGSDEERTLTPVNTIFANNLFYTEKQGDIFRVLDDISGIAFSGNKVQGPGTTKTKGVDRVELQWKNLEIYPIPISDSLLTTTPSVRPVRTDLTGTVRTRVRAGAVIPGNERVPVALRIKPGVDWPVEKPSVKTASEVPGEYKVIEVAPGRNTLEKAVKKATDHTVLQLSEGIYEIDKGMPVTSKLVIRGKGSAKTAIRISKDGDVPNYFFRVQQGKSLTLDGVEIDAGRENPVKYGIISPVEPSSEAYRLKLNDVYLHGFTQETGAVFKAYKGTFADTIRITNSRIEDSHRGLNLSYEKEDKGKYNAEVIDIQNTLFKDLGQFALYYYRGGNDESTIGGQLLIDHSVFYNVDNNEKGRILRTRGIVYVTISNSVFAGSPEAKQAVVLQGSKNSMVNTVIYNSGELKLSGGAISANILRTNPMWTDTRAFKPEEKSPLKNAATDKRDIGLLQMN